MSEHQIGDFRISSSPVCGSAFIGWTLPLEGRSTRPKLAQCFWLGILSSGPAMITLVEALVDSTSDFITAQTFMWDEATL